MLTYGTVRGDARQRSSGGNGWRCHSKVERVRRSLAASPALLALLVTGASGVLGSHASSAFASLPEWGSCQATGIDGGRYSDPGCTVRATREHGERTGGYEWTPLPTGRRVRLEPMTASGAIVFQTVAGKRIECAELYEESTGVADGRSKAGTPLWELGSCTSEGGECRSSGAPFFGEINDLYAWEERPAEPGRPAPGWEGKLGFVSRGPETPQVGVEYRVKNHELLFSPVGCEAPIGTVWIGGARQGGNSFLTLLEPVDTMTSSFTETLQESSPGVQQPAGFEGRAGKHLMAYLENHWEPLAITATFHLGVEEGGFKLEIKAIP